MEWAYNSRDSCNVTMQIWLASLQSNSICVDVTNPRRYILLSSLILWHGTGIWYGNSWCYSAFPFIMTVLIFCMTRYAFLSTNAGYWFLNSLRWFLEWHTVRPEAGRWCGLYIDGGRNSSPNFWTWFIVQPSLEAILLLHVMGTISKSTMDAVPLIFNSWHDSSSFKIFGRGFLSDNTGCVDS